ncbi:MAG: hypothetical protein NVS4B3_03300 [Gemmatimonadaceae bacterium]
MTADGREAAYALIALLLVPTPRADAQVAPNAPWYTLATSHFRVHFTAGSEGPARKAGGAAERAYTQLARELHEPRGPIDIVISDDVDFANGSATPVPTNRITVYAHPPVDVPALRLYDDWMALVITHELTHIFHLDRARGVWHAAQAVFGRHPVFFPNLYAPAWLVEGLAVYYESRLTGSGRMEGSEHRMIARAAALAGNVPALGALSLASTRYPYGESAYAYGSLFVDYLARTRGDSTVGRFVERMSSFPLPFFLDWDARRGFGVGFDEAYREWRDSLVRDVGPARSPLPAWRELTREGRAVAGPRWRGDGSLVYAANTGIRTTGAYSVDTAGGGRRLGRRDAVEPQAVIPEEALLYAQLDFTDPYHIRSDLYRSERGEERRLTVGARLTHPDVRGTDSGIVAVRATPFATELVRVDARTGVVSPFATGSLDMHWTEPRWSPDGTQVAAARWTRGGTAAIVLLDTTGVVTRELFRARAVVASPSWTRDGRRVLFASDETGIMNVYEATTDSVPVVRRLSDSQTGLSAPETSPSGRWIAAVHFRADGEHVGIAPYDSTAGNPAQVSAPKAAPLPPAPPDSGPVSEYSAIPSLVPRYWYPIVDRDAHGELSLGAGTSGHDVIGRHAYAASLTVRRGSGEVEGGTAYRWRGWGRPVVDFAADQVWDFITTLHPAGSATSAPLGELRRRTRSVALSATLPHPRLRTISSVTLGAGGEWREFATNPSPLLPRVLGLGSVHRVYPLLFLAAGWSNAQHPNLAISSEDGLSFVGTVRQRWRLGAGDSASTLAVGVLSVYKSIPFPGFAHHVAAVRIAAGIQDQRAPSEFSVGGTNGSSLELIPGINVGSDRRTFGVRGFPAGARRGIRAVAGSGEYRMPLAAPSRGLPVLPAFLDRASLSVFGDAAVAGCPVVLTMWGPCAASTYDAQWIMSSGAELDLDTAVQYDAPLRLRLGIAVPVVDNSLLPVPRATVYFTLGVNY